MKKVILIISIFSICITAAFSANSNINLNGDVEHTPYTLKLKYNFNDSYTDINDTYDLFNGNSRFNLTENGRTSNFIVTISGNENYVPNVRLSMGINPFVAEDYSPSKYKSTDYVVVNRSNFIYNSPKTGFNNDFQVYQFYFYWSGNTELTAGDYTSTVYIGYSVE